MWTGVWQKVYAMIQVYGVQDSARKSVSVGCMGHAGARNTGRTIHMGLSQD